MIRFLIWFLGDSYQFETGWKTKQIQLCCPRLSYLRGKLSYAGTHYPESATSIDVSIQRLRNGVSKGRFILINPFQ